MPGLYGVKTNLPLDGETFKTSPFLSDSWEWKDPDLGGFSQIKVHLDPAFCLAEIREHGDLSLSSPLSH